MGIKKNDLDFNSIKVRLEQAFLYLAVLFKENFNSIKVRLERWLVTKAHQTLLFQFHKGTIRTQEAYRKRTFFFRISIP